MPLDIDDLSKKGACSDRHQVIDIIKFPAGI